MNMHTPVTRGQFQISEEAVIHGPTGAEFTPTFGQADSVTIWTGDIGNRLPSGETYRYADVLAMMRTVWRERPV
jgi:hypothetical protein